jgi:Calcium-binding EGF domain
MLLHLVNADIDLFSNKKKFLCLFCWSLDIDECQHPNIYPCHGICVNVPGAYECICPKGKHGNATVGECISNLTTTAGKLNCLSERQISKYFLAKKNPMHPFELTYILILEYQLYKDDPRTFILLSASN